MLRDTGTYYLLELRRVRDFRYCAFNVRGQLSVRLVEDFSLRLQASFPSTILSEQEDRCGESWSDNSAERFYILKMAGGVENGHCRDCAYE
jgi:hypothetical protein